MTSSPKQQTSGMTSTTSDSKLQTSETTSVISVPKQYQTSETNEPVYMNTTSEDTGDATGTYAQLGDTFRDLTDKMKDTITEMKKEVPFVDEKEDLLISRENLLSDAEDDDPELDAAIREAIGFKDDLVVDRIQLEDQPQGVGQGAEAGGGGSCTSTLLVSNRKCSGSDVIHVTTNQVVKREFKDV